VSDETKRRIFGAPSVQHDDIPGNLVPAVVALVPGDLLTDENGPNRRLRVDVAQTGFFAGREFRTFREFATAFTGTYIVKVIAPVDYIIFEIGAECDGGQIRLESVAGGTEGGSFAETLPVIPRNSMLDAPAHAPQLELTAGGTLTGGTTLDVLRLKTDTNSQRRFSIGENINSERGNGPGTIYLRATCTDFTGVIRGWWEERP